MRRRAHAPVGTTGQFIGGHEFQVVLRNGNRVGAGECGQGLGGGNSPIAFPGCPQIIHQGHLEPGHDAIGVYREGDIVVAIPGLAAPGEQVLAPVFDPLHRTTGRLARKQATDIAAPGAALAPEAPAMGLGNNVHLVGGETEACGPAQTKHARGLNAAVDGQVEFHGVPLGNTTKGLGGICAQTIPTELLTEHVGRLAESGIDIAPGEDPVHHHVALLGIEHPRAVGLHGLEGISHRLQCVVFHLDEFQGILGHPAVRGGHSGHGFAHVMDFVPSNAVNSPSVGRGLGGIAPAPGILTGHHRHHSVQGLGPARVNTRDAPMG